ncbi:MAG: tetratricopeptide repeat protein [Candidatus Methanoperedens sp.]|nr:tetratricopeptide repeat protein [Candidatus Methanoperedens sp.]
MKILPVNLDDLIYARSVESARREFKKTWSEPILEEVIQSICAFANDYFNLNGGYIIIGIEEANGQPVLPPHGLEDYNLEDIQKHIRSNCRRIDPEYQPVLSPEIYQGKQILVIWAPGGELRPYQAPETLQKGGGKAYFISQRGETINAEGDILTQLMQMTAKVPFDDRRNNSVPVDVISSSLVRKYLTDIRSDLIASDVNLSDRDLYRFMKIVSPMNGHEAPRNVALLFFTEKPEQYFPGTQIEVVQFGDDAGGDLIEERIFRGPLNFQLIQSLDYLNSSSTSMIKKIPGQAETHKSVAFPYEAMEEALVNAVYHRSYEISEPIKVYIYPDRMEIISYPGPVAGIELRHLQAGGIVPPVQNRNRRIGEFLKEPGLAEGRGTGIPKIKRKMNENGSPDPEFEFDDGRTYFRVILPAHPQYVVINALRTSANLWAAGERKSALANLEQALKRVPTSGALIRQLIEYRTLGNLSSILHRFREATRGMIKRVLRRPTYSEELTDKGIEEFAAERYEPAISYFEEALKVNPRNFYAINNKGMVLYSLRRYDEAIECYNKALEIKPDYHEALNNLGNALLDLAQRKMGKEAEDLFRQSFEKYEKVIKIKPDKSEALNNWGVALSALARMKEGKEAWDLFKQAFEKYERALKIKPDYHKALNNWGIDLSGIAKMKEGKEAEDLFKQAFEKFERALKVKPDKIEALNNWGVALAGIAKMKKGKEAWDLFKQAFLKFEWALKIKPDYYEALYNWGFTLAGLARMKKGKEAEDLFKQAFEKYRKALKIKPDSYDTLNNWGFALAGLARMKKGKIAQDLVKQAFEKYERALVIKPDFYEVFNNWGHDLADLAKTRKGRVAEDLFKQAFEKYERALVIKPDYYEALNNWGHGLADLAKRKGGKEAKDLFEQSSEKLMKAEEIK